MVRPTEPRLADAASFEIVPPEILERPRRDEAPRLDRDRCAVLLDQYLRRLGSQAGRGERIEIRGFGSFVVKHRQAREGRNPKTGALVPVAAKRVPFFKVGKELKLRVDGKQPTEQSPVPTTEAPSAGG